jgi:hypothetical protein
VGDSIAMEDSPYAFRYDDEDLVITMTREGEELLSVPLIPLIERALEYSRSQPPNTQMPADVLTVEAEAQGVRFAVSVTSIGGFVDASGDSQEGGSSTYRITMLNADYYFFFDSSM